MERVVKVSRPSVGVREVKLDGISNPTVFAVLQSAGMDFEGCQVRVNNQPADMKDSVKEGDRVSILPPVQGNR